MKTVSTLRALKQIRKPICMAAGFFDGLHRGHRALLLAAISSARSNNGSAWIFTFAAHPLRTLSPAKAPLLLTSRDHKLKLLKSMGMDGCLMLNFSRRLANLPPEKFIEQLCRNVPSLKCMIIGNNWRFGRGGAGSIALLRRTMAKKGISVIVVEPVRCGNEIISSTRIRESVLNGRMEDARMMLGRPFSIYGIVVRGKAIGRRIGFPTANIDSHNEIRPPNGIYAVQADIGHRIIVNGVLSIGTRPTFSSDGKTTIELHIPGFHQNLYGRAIEIFFIRKIRDERKFQTVEQLTKQVARDIAIASMILKKESEKIV